MKRPSEDSSSGDSDSEEYIDVGCENMYSSGHIKASFIRCASPTTTTQVIARKKRRGIIEKKRRDRINNCLSELRGLVPSAFEKQGSAKLEKAEILQMTVDHLKMLQATGGKGFFDAQALALDFLSLGFRECVSEVSRYLSSVEGLDCTDPLRSRLLSHLTSCASRVYLPPQHHYPHHPHPYLPPTGPPRQHSDLRCMDSAHSRCPLRGRVSHFSHRTASPQYRLTSVRPPPPQCPPPVLRRPTAAVNHTGPGELKWGLSDT
ncbi:hypothetical protein WMY93_016204 [Mugilogobius chulae]|uniref:Hairy/enhancer-of-split related with YRPW motif protein 2 n=1 Tax=Mugilogobius chulae TaxID=88201 RepID=A0AAW0NTI0_9GOBI